MRWREVHLVAGEVRRDPLSPWQRLAGFGLRWAITAVAVWIAAEVVGGIHYDGWPSILVVAFILGLLNAYLKPLLVIGALPAVVLTLGLGLILINTALLALTAWIAGKFDSIDFSIDGFWDALFGAVLISVVSFVLTRVVRPDRLVQA
ncbi:MAG: hypothetical protein Kow0010_04650 [Dehalococcoidia bacterium]